MLVVALHGAEEVWSRASFSALLEKATGLAKVLPICRVLINLILIDRSEEVLRLSVLDMIEVVHISSEDPL